MRVKLLGTILLSILLVNCKTQHQATYKKQMKEAYIYMFKLTYFRKFLILGFNESDAIKTVVSNDFSGYGEPLLSLEDYEIIDSLTHIDNRVMVKDSSDRIGTVSEGAQGKHVFSYALAKYQSKWLDSLAKTRYKIYARSLNEE